MNDLNFWSWLNEHCFPYGQVTSQRVTLRTQGRWPEYKADGAKSDPWGLENSVLSGILQVE